MTVLHCTFCTFGYPAELTCGDCGAHYCRAGCTDITRICYGNMRCPKCRPAYLAGLETETKDGKT